MKPKTSWVWLLSDLVLRTWKGKKYSITFSIVCTLIHFGPSNRANKERELSTNLRNETASWMAKNSIKEDDAKDDEYYQECKCCRPPRSELFKIQCHKHLTTFGVILALFMLQLFPFILTAIKTMVLYSLVWTKKIRIVSLKTIGFSREFNRKWNMIYFSKWHYWQE